MATAGVGAKVTPAKFYQELRRQLGAPMQAAGFTLLAGGAPLWHRPAAGGHLNVFIECDKWGWNATWGCTFTVGFFIGPAPGTTAGPGASTGIGYLLEGFDEFDELRVRNNAVIARLPGTLRNEVVLGHTRDGREYVAQGFREQAERFELGTDLWLNYYTLDDARDWGGFFAARLPRYAAMHEQGTRSALGAGRVRFDRALGAVQALADDQLAQKLVILDDFIRAEPTAYWQEAGRYWLTDIAKAKPA